MRICIDMFRHSYNGIFLCSGLTIGCLLLLMSLGEPASAKDAIPLKKNMTITRARAALLRDGWKPVETFEKDYSGELLHFDAQTSIIYKGMGIKEVEFCNGTGFAYCFFNYKKADRCLQVETKGEYWPEDHSEPRVVVWTSDCPPF